MKKLHLYFTFFGLFLLGGYAANAQQFVVKGTVQDSKTKDPVGSAIVSIPGTSKSTYNDDNGTFRIGADTKFDSIRIELIGYTRQSVYVGNGQASYNILLQPSGSMMNEVQVQGVQHSQSVTSLNSADLNRASGLNLQDALNTVPGVNMESRSPWGGQHIVIRGYYPSADNGRTDGENFNGLGYQLYINNIPVTDATGLTIMDDIDFSTLGKVDIQKGPSPLYGSYIAGAVNLYTPRPAPNETSINEQLIAGSYGLLRTNTSIATSDGKSDFWINYGHQTYNGFRPNDGSRKDYVSLASNSYASPKQTISTYFSYAHSYEDLAGELDSSQFYGKQAVSDANYVGNNSHVEIQSFRAGVTDRYDFSDHFNFQATVFGSGSTLNQFFAHGFNKDVNTNLGGRLALNFVSRTDALSVDGTVGFSALRSDQNAQGNFILPFVSPPFTQNSPHDNPSDVQNYAITSAIFTQWAFTLPSRWSLTVGASLNYVTFGTQNLLHGKNDSIYLNEPILSNTFAPVFTPSACLSKIINNNMSVYASYGMGYAPPTISEITNSAGQVNTSLKPESAVQYEIGTKGSLGGTNQFSYQLALFDMDVTNRLTSEVANGISYYTNVGEQSNIGAELYAGYAIINDKNSFLSLVRPWVSLAYSDFTYVDFETHTKAHNGGDSVTANYSKNKVAEVSPIVLNIGLDVATKMGFYLNATYRYVDRAPVTFDNDHYMSAYGLLGARIGYKQDLGKHFVLDVFAGGDNLLSAIYYNFIFVGNNIQELAQGTDTYVKNGGGDGYILPAPYKATFYGGISLKYRF